MAQNSWKNFVGCGLAFLLLVPPLAAAPRQPSDAQILAMGVDKWMAYYAKMQGVEEIEPTDREAMGIYTEALTQRDDDALRRLPPAQRQRFKRLRAALTRLHEDTLIVAQDDSGGGTMYLDFMASATVDDEELIATLIRTQPGPATSGERRRLAARQAKTRLDLIKARRSPPDAAGLSADDKQRLQTDAAKLPGDLRALQTALATVPDSQTQLVWDYVDLSKWLDAGGDH